MLHYKNQADREPIQKLMDNVAIKRIAGFQNSK